MSPDLHGVESEPQFQQREYRALPAESMSASPPANSMGEMESVQSSVFSEPHLAPNGARTEFAQLLEAKRARSTPAGAFGWAIVAGIAAGPFAVLSAFVGGNPGHTNIFYVLVAGPIVEEIVKQSGLFYLLEKKPWLLIARWQFPLCAALTALVFASIENVLYLTVYARNVAESMRHSLVLVRWTVCVAMHVGCALIASMGMTRAWRETTLAGKPASFSRAANYIGIAALAHGLYNVSALLLDEIWI